MKYSMLGFDGPKGGSGEMGKFFIQESRKWVIDVVDEVDPLGFGGRIGFRRDGTEVVEVD